MRITLTGADERTSIDALVSLALDCSVVEIGLLFTASPEGRNRYPSLDWLKDAAQALSGRCAIHVCGGAARAMLKAGELAPVTLHAPRVQVNGVIPPADLPSLADRVDTLITQHCPSNSGLVHAPVDNHVLLVDGSGGRGISPEAWERPSTNKDVGFAGGLGPGNLCDELCRIGVVASGEWWVDMEGKLRKDDWFDVAAARSAAELFSAALVRQ